MSAGSRSFQSRTRPRIRRHALAMSACCACGHPRARHTPCFQSTPRGTTGHADMPSRAGLTACQMSMNGWPTTKRVGATRSAAHGVGDAGFLGSRDQVVDQHTQPPARAGPEILDDPDEIVDAAEVFDDDALDPQVVTPHLLDELGVVAALDVDAAGARHLGLRARHRDRTGRGTCRRRSPPPPRRGQDHRLAVDQVPGADRKRLALRPCLSSSSIRPYSIRTTAPT